MLGWFQALMPKEELFFDHFNAHAATLVQGADALRKLLEGGEALKPAADALMQHEHEADLITREIMMAVQRSFITPFDRGDIKGLTTSMDDAIDQMKQTAKVILLYEVTEFDPAMRQMADIIQQCAKLTTEIISLLGSMRKNAGRLNALCEEITRIEEKADDIHDQGLKDLFRAHRQSDPMAFIIGTEMYSHLEKVVDRFEDVANRVNGIVIEHI